MTTQNQKTVLNVEVPERQQTLLNIMFQKANITADMIMEDALKRWIIKNVDLLTENELKDFADLLPSLQPKNKKTTKAE